MLLAGLGSGCSWFDVRPGVRVEAIEGIERIEYDGLDVTIYKARAGAGSDKRMQVFLSASVTGAPVVAFREAQSAALRPGDFFYLKAADGTLEEYELLTADEQDMTFRRQVATQQRDNVGAETHTRVRTTVVRLKPYPPESRTQPEPSDPPGPSDPQAPARGRRAAP